MFTRNDYRICRSYNRQCYPTAREREAQRALREAIRQGQSCPAGVPARWWQAQQQIRADDIVKCREVVNARRALTNSYVVREEEP